MLCYRLTAKSLKPRCGPPERVLDRLQKCLERGGRTRTRGPRGLSAVDKPKRIEALELVPRHTLKDLD